MVVLAHVAVMCPVRRPWAITLSWIGQFGVDLFFVLSGWLIGGLFWAERARYGTVIWPRFFLRRALRTMPPYFAVLPVAWLAVRLFAPGRTPFDFSYLVFLQNYRDKIPYYAVSWSLCVEEHFYLFLPALALLVLAWRIPPPLLFATLFAVSPLCRIFFETTRNFNDFNRGVLATHLRLDGLVLGFWASYVHACQPWAWARFARCARWLWMPALGLLMLSPAIPDAAFYCWGPTLMAVIFLVIIGIAVVAPSWRLPAPAAVQRLAGMSYSIYLTHSLVIHIARAAALRGGAWAEAIYWPLALVTIVGVGWTFCRLVEIPSMRWRDRLVPSVRRA